MDLKTRMKSKAFWLTLIPAVLLLIQVVLVPFGYQFEIEGINNQLLSIVNALFAVLSILGIAVDPTTSGIKDNKEDFKE